jgi:predicted chitinase
VNLLSWLGRLFAAPAPSPAPPAAPALSQPAVPVAAVGDPPRVVVTEAMVRAGFPRCADPAAWAKAWTAAFARFPAFAPLGAACGIGKSEVETGGLTKWDEDLYYTSVAQVALMHGTRAVTSPAAVQAMAGYRSAIQAARRAKAADPAAPVAIAQEVTPLLRNPKALGDRVYAALGGYAARGGGGVQLTGLANQQAFAIWLGVSLAEARDYMRTIEGAAMTVPWYLSHFGGLEAANRGDMREILRIVAGKRSQADLAIIWSSIHGDAQMAAFQRWRRLFRT